MAGTSTQISFALEPSLYDLLRALAEKERKTVPQTALELLEDALRQQTREVSPPDDLPSHELGALAMSCGAFDWLADEPDLYDDTHGEPIR